MTVRVEGVLKTPINTPAANVPIKIITAIGAGETLSSSEVTYVTDEFGNYGFDLVYATHEIYAMFDDAFELIGTSVANDSVPTPTNINDLLHFSTPIQPEIVDKIYDDVYGCIDDLENDINTCITCMGDQIVQGDTGVCQSMVIYTNDCLQACSAELTEITKAGDAQTLSQAQAYTDATGTELACCTEILSTSLAQLCTTMVASTEANGSAIATLCTDMEAGDASVIQSSKAYTDACTGAVESSISNMVTACDAVVHTCMSAISDADGLHQSGYSIVTSAGDAKASITLLASSMTEEGVEKSEILMQADKILMHNGDANTLDAPFYMEAGKVYIKEANIKDLSGDKIKSNTSIVVGSGNTSAALSGVGEWRMWAGHANAGSAPFRVHQSGYMCAANVDIRGRITATSGSFSGSLSGATGSFCGALCAASGTFNGVLCAASGSFTGTVYADKISGDVVTSKIYSAGNKTAARQGPSWGGWETFYTVTVTNAASRARSLVITVRHNVYTSNSSYVGSGQLRVTGSFGTITAYEYHGVNTEKEQTFVVHIPANTTGYMTIQTRAKGGSSGSNVSTGYSLVGGVSGNYFQAQLITAGSDLG